MSKAKIKWIWVLFIIVSTFFVAITITAENHEQTQPKIEGNITNNGPVTEGSTIIFTAACTGANTKLVICRENTICNAQTQPSDFLCASSLATEAAKQCSYTTTALDKGVHANDVATCCDENNICDTTVTQVSSWSVTQVQQQQPTITVVDEASNPVPASVAKQETITHITFENQPIAKIALTNLQGATFGLSKVARGIIAPENSTFVKVYALDLEDIFFDEATLTATASASLLYRCKFWDFSLSTCLGSWELVKPITAGQEYTFNLMKGAFGFAEASPIQPSPEPAQPPPSQQPQPENIEEQIQPLIEQPKEEPKPEENITIIEPRPVEPDIAIEAPITNNGPVEEGKNIVFAGTCLGNFTKLVICRENSICNAQIKKEDLLCESAATEEAGKTCAYQTEVKDLGEHANDIATCCTEQGECATTTVLIEPWEIQEKQQKLPLLPTIMHMRKVLEWNASEEDPEKRKDGGRLFNRDLGHVSLSRSEEILFSNQSLAIEATVQIMNESQGAILSKYDYLNGKHVELSVNPGGAIFFSIAEQDLSVDIEVNKTYNDGQFHTINASIDHGNVTLIIDDVLEAQESSFIDELDSDLPFAIGANTGYIPWFGFPINHYTGVIKDVKIFSE